MIAITKNVHRKHINFLRYGNMEPCQFQTWATSKVNLKFLFETSIFIVLCQIQTVMGTEKAGLNLNIDLMDGI